MVALSRTIGKTSNLGIPAIANPATAKGRLVKKIAIIATGLSGADFKIKFQIAWSNAEPSKKIKTICSS